MPGKELEIKGWGILLEGHQLQCSSLSEVEANGHGTTFRVRVEGCQDQIPNGCSEFRGESHPAYSNAPLKFVNSMVAEGLSWCRCVAAAQSYTREVA